MYLSFDDLTKWVAETPPGERYLWVLDKQSKEIRWESRKVVSWWTGNETARLQAIFYEMFEQIPYNLEAQDHQEFTILTDLRDRVSDSYDKFMLAHQSIFGIIYRFLFAYFLSDIYDDLKNKLDQILNASFDCLNLSVVPPKQIEYYCNIIQDKGISPRLQIKWNSLSLDQFKAAIPLEAYAQPITLTALDRERTEALLSLNPGRINDFYPSDLESHLSRIAPEHLKHLNDTNRSVLNLSKLTHAQLMAVLKSDRLLNHRLSSLDFSNFSSNEMIELTKACPQIVSGFPPQVIEDIVAEIEPTCLKYLNYQQIDALDFTQLSGEQVLNLPYTYSLALRSDKIQLLNLDRFTASQISKVFSSPSSIRSIPPAMIAANLAKFEPAMLRNFSKPQIAPLNIPTLTIDQIINLSGRFSSDEWKKVELSHYTKASIAKLLAHRSDIISMLSPATIAANILAIPEKYYFALSRDQLKAIDYSRLDKDRIRSFSSYQLEQMKNYPKKPAFTGASHRSDPNDFFFQFFGYDPFGRSPPFGSTPSFFDFHSDSFWDQFFEQSGRSYTQQQTAAQGPKFAGYHSSLDSAVCIIRTQNKENTNPVYESLRKKCLLRSDELKREPLLVFTDNPNDLTDDTLKKAYKKLALACHPDKNKDNIDEATELFRVVNEAYKAVTKD